MRSRSVRRLTHRPTALALLLLSLTAALAGAGRAAAATAASPLFADPLLGSAAAPPLAEISAATRGLSPADIHAAYSLPDTGAHRQTIAVVSAYDDPSAGADLNAYGKRFGLSPCTRANRCLRTLNERGKRAPLPPSDPSGGQWSTESAVGLEIAHGVCESCSLMLIEADTPNEGDLASAIKAAGRAGATVVVTSATPVEGSFDPQYASELSQPKTAVVAAAGDAAAGMWGYSGSLNFPSALPDVLAVGGTHLSISSHGGYAGEQAWSRTVSGCSLYEMAPAWQAKAAASVDCGTARAVADVSAAADPGAIVRVTGAGIPGGPWYFAGGTSVSAPIIAGVIGLAGSLGNREARTLYRRARSDPGAFHDIRTGVTAPGCGSSICKATAGYDGPTGLGTPDGLAAFLPSGGALARRHPKLTVSAPSGGLQIRGGWKAPLRVRNDNPFALTGQIEVRRTVRVGNGLWLYVFASGKLRLGPLAAASERLSIAKRYRGLLKRLGSEAAFVVVHVRGPAGRGVTVSTPLRLYAP